MLASRVAFREGRRGAFAPPPPPPKFSDIYIYKTRYKYIIHVMQGQKCTRGDPRACLFSKVSWESMPPDHPSAIGTRISPAPSKLPCSHICPPPFLNFLNATLASLNYSLSLSLSLSRHELIT